MTTSTAKFRARPSALPWLLLGATLLSACHASDDDSEWTFVSNPGTGSGGVGGGVVIGYSGGNARQSEIRANSIGLARSDIGRVVGLEVEDVSPSPELPDRRFVLGTQSDFAVLLAKDGAEVHGPCFAGGQLTLGGVTRARTCPDSATLLTLECADGQRLRLSAWGNLAIHETSGFVSVLGPEDEPAVHGPETRISARGREFHAQDRSGSTWRIVPPPPPAPGHQFTFARRHRSIRFFDPSGSVSAELPQAGFTIQDELGGLLLRGEFPVGLPGVHTGPFVALLPLRNRHLLVLPTR